MDSQQDDSDASLFWPTLYYALHPDVRHARVDALQHYTRLGRQEKRTPHPLLDAILLSSVAAQTLDGQPVGILSAFLQGEEDLRFNLLVDIAYLKQQDESLQTAQDCFRAIADPDVRLALRPHPLFDPEFYRAVTPSRHYENELIDYLVANPKTGRPHPLFDGEYYLATGGGGVEPSEPALHWYLCHWRQWQGDVSPFVDLKFLNHQLQCANADWEKDNLDPLSFALTNRIDCFGPLIHPHVDTRVVEQAFSNLLLRCHHGPEALQAAEVVKSIALSDEANKPRPPSVSVIILNFKKHVYTFFSVAAALNALRDTPVEIIVVENGGDTFFFECMLKYFSKLEHVQYLKMGSNKFYGEGNNIGIDRAIGPYLLLLNNDCFLIESFGKNLSAHISSTSDAHVIGALLSYPDGSVQEFGGLISDCGQVIQRAKGLPRSYLAAHGGVEQVDYASAACLIISRHAMDHVAGFDLLFEPFYYEDTDLCRRLRQAGFKIVVDPSMEAFHIENASTIETLGNDTFRKMVADHKEVFARRWMKDTGAGAYVKVRADDEPLPIRAKSKRKSDRPTAVVYTPFEFRTGGGERYLLSAAKALATNHEVTICSNDHFSRARVLHVLMALGISEFDFKVCDTISNVRAISQDVDVLFAMGNEIMPPIAPIGRVNLFHLQFPFPWRHLPFFNFNLVELYDAIIVNSSFTRSWTGRRMQDAGIRRPPPILELSPPVRRIEPLRGSSSLRDDTLHVVTVGRFFVGGHSKRQDVFLRIFELARQRTSTPIRATLIGAIHNSADAHEYYGMIARMANRMHDVEVIVDAPASVLDETLRNADIYIHCAGFGLSELETPERMEHFGISIVEAIQAGCIPLVYAGGGPQEVVLKSSIGYTFETVDVAVQQLVRLCDPAQRRDAKMSLNHQWITDVLEPAFAVHLENILEKVRHARSSGDRRSANVSKSIRAPKPSDES